MQLFYEFDDFRIGQTERLLKHNGKVVPLPPKVVDLLCVLLESGGRVVTKEELMKRLWPDSFVEEANLSRNVFLLRKVLGDLCNGEELIETIPRRGYRFAGHVTTKDDQAFELTTREQRRAHILVEEEIETDIAPASDDESEGAVKGPVSYFRTGSRFWRRLVPSLLVLTIAGGVALVGLKMIGWTNSKSTPFDEIRMTQLTTTGKGGFASISPDGNYVAYISNATGEKGLRLRHLPTGSDKEILAPPDGSIVDVTFSADGNQIYFYKFEPEGNVLYQIPILGGSARRIWTNMDSKVTFSPSGEQFAFLRGDPSRNEAYLILAALDGSEEQKLLTYPIGDLFLDGPHALAPAWSPDGESIAFGHKDSAAGRPNVSVMSFQLKDRTQKVIATYPWSFVGEMCWLRDGSGLVVVAAELEAAAAQQIWHVSNSTGIVRRITSDLNDYQSVSISADAANLVSLQTKRTSNIWLLPDSDASRATQLTFNNNDGINGISWTPDGRIVFLSRVSGKADIWIINSDGTGREQLTFDFGWCFQPSVSPDGRYLIFVSGPVGGGGNVWKMDLGNKSLKQLTNDWFTRRPQWTPDGQWVVYSCLNAGQPKLCKVPADGGNAVLLTDTAAQLLSVSPMDGQIAYLFIDEGPPPKNRVAIIPPEGGSPTKIFDFAFPNVQAIKWSVDENALTFIDTRSGVSNIWKLPIESSQPLQLTDLKSDLIFSFDRSRRNNDLAVARGTRTGDVVLIKDINGQH